MFLKVAKQGSTLAGIMDAFAISVSHGLQYGVPLRAFVDMFTNMRFEPAGMTDDPDIRFATSLVDYIFRRLAVEYLPVEERAEIGVLTVERAAAAHAARRRGGHDAVSEPGVDAAAARGPCAVRRRCSPPPGARPVAATHRGARWCSATSAATSCSAPAPATPARAAAPPAAARERSLDALELRLECVEDLFAVPGDAMLREHARLYPGIDELVQALDARPVRIPRVVIRLPAEALRDDTGARIGNAVRAYCDQRLEHTRHQIAAQRRDGLRALILGVVLFSIGFLVARWVSRATSTPTSGCSSPTGSS